MRVSQSMLQQASRLHSKIVSNSCVVPRTIFNSRLPELTPQYKAVIFDKDGTLIYFDTMWTSWAKTLTSRITDQFGKKFELPIYNLLGICAQTSKIKSGLLAEGTSEQIETAISTLLSEHGVDRSLAKETVIRHVETIAITSENVEEVEDINQLFTVLRRNSVNVCVCTSDSRAATEKTLDTLGVSNLVDILKTGDDAPLQPKPDPFHACNICSSLRLKSEEVMMVGDTATDLLFAKNAALGHAVGVLSGIGEFADLKRAWNSPESSHEPPSASKLNFLQPNATSRFSIVHSISDILPILFPNSVIPVAYDRGNVTSADPSLATANKPVRLIVFDKDGSLAPVYPRWSNWAKELANRLSKVVSRDFAALFLDGLGLERTDSTGNLLAGGSICETRDRIIGLLLLNGVHLRDVYRIFDEVWMSPGNQESPMYPDVKNTLDHLRCQGIQLAINTSDERIALHRFLKSNSLYDKIDFAISAEEQGNHPKPDPISLLNICNKLKVLPSETLVVGDTAADLVCGSKAGCGGTVGVLSGFSASHQIMPFANVIAPNITYLPKMLDQLRSL